MLPCLCPWQALQHILDQAIGKQEELLCKGTRHSSQISPRTPPASAALQIPEMLEEVHYSKPVYSSPFDIGSNFSNVLFPDFWMAIHISRKHGSAFVGLQFDHFDATFAQPVDSPAKVHRLPDEHQPNSKLAD